MWACGHEGTRELLEGIHGKVSENTGRMGEVALGWHPQGASKQPWVENSETGSLPSSWSPKVLPLLLSLLSLLSILQSMHLQELTPIWYAWFGSLLLDGSWLLHRAQCSVLVSNAFPWVCILKSALKSLETYWWIPVAYDKFSQLVFNAVWEWQNNACCVLVFLCAGGIDHIHHWS